VGVVALAQIRTSPRVMTIGWFSSSAENTNYGTVPAASTIHTGITAAAKLVNTIRLSDASDCPPPRRGIANTGRGHTRS